MVKPPPDDFLPEEVKIKICEMEIDAHEREITAYILQQIVVEQSKEKQTCYKCHVIFLPVKDGGGLSFYGWKCSKCAYGICL